MRHRIDGNQAASFSSSVSTTCLIWREEAVSLDEPGAAVAGCPVVESEPKLLDVPEGTEPEELLFESAEEALDAPIRWWPSPCG